MRQSKGRQISSCSLTAPNYLLRTSVCGRNPAELWQFYIQLAEFEAAYKNLTDDLQLRPIFRQLEPHIFVAFIAWCDVFIRANP